MLSKVTTEDLVVGEMQPYLIAGAAFLILSAILGLLLCFKRFRTTVESKIESLKKAMFWNGVIKTLFVSYFKTIIVASMKLQDFLFHAEDEE